MPKRPLILRSPELDARYRAERAQFPRDYDPFEKRKDEDPLRKWKYWILFENIYPYDAVADVHHLLVAERKFATPGEMTPEEGLELAAIKRELREDYDAFIENFPRIQSVPARLHFHLVVWKKR